MSCDLARGLKQCRAPGKSVSGRAIPRQYCNIYVGEPGQLVGQLRNWESILWASDLALVEN